MKMVLVGFMYSDNRESEKKTFNVILFAICLLNSVQVYKL